MKRIAGIILVICVLMQLTACNSVKDTRLEDINSVWGMPYEQVVEKLELGLPVNTDSDAADTSGSFEVYYCFENLTVESYPVSMTLFFDGYCDSEPLLFQIKLLFSQNADAEKVLSAWSNEPDYLKMEQTMGFRSNSVLSLEDRNWLETYTSIRVADTGFITEQGRYDPEKKQFIGSGKYIGTEYPLIVLNANVETGVFQLTNSITAMLNQKEAIQQFLSEK